MTALNMTALNMTTLNLTASKRPAAAAAPFAIRAERAADAGAREALLDAAFGPGRFERTCQRLRDGRLPAEGLAFVATCHGSMARSAARVVGTLRLWHVNAGGKPALMLGPLAVDPACRSLGIGAALMVHAIAAAERRGDGAVVLLGDAPYYARFGFSAAATGALTLPGPFERDRLLALELREGALADAAGMILPTGAADGWSRSRGRRAVAKAA